MGFALFKIIFLRYQSLSKIGDFMVKIKHSERELVFKWTLIKAFLATKKLNFGRKVIFLAFLVKIFKNKKLIK